jgi:hypothetical protein
MQHLVLQYRKRLVAVSYAPGWDWYQVNTVLAESSAWVESPKRVVKII